MDNCRMQRKEEEGDWGGIARKSPLCRENRKGGLGEQTVGEPRERVPGRTWKKSAASFPGRDGRPGKDWKKGMSKRREVLWKESATNRKGGRCPRRKLHEKEGSAEQEQRGDFSEGRPKESGKNYKKENERDRNSRDKT